MKRLLCALGVILPLASGAPAEAHSYPPEPGPGVELIAPGPPPPMRYEVVPPAPREVVIWQPGHWHWEGRRQDWVWIPGRYVERPHRYAMWEPGHWIERHHEWVWVPGHWR
jgi:hypothetical protein